jgi:hypothetical protein
MLAGRLAIQLPFSYLPLVGGGPKPDGILEGKPSNTDCLDHGQVGVVGGVTVPVGVLDYRHRVDRQRNCRYDDEENRYDGYHLDK